MTSKMPSVSIVTPAYNAARTIGTAIESVLAQTIADFELIICDDASQDDTAQAISDCEDERIILLRNTVNLGAGPSRDRAIAQARGQWVTFLDADDAWMPQRLERLLSVAMKHPDAVVFDELMECHDTPHGLVPWRKMRSDDAFHGRPDEAREINIGEWIGYRRLTTFPLIPLHLIQTGSVQHPEIPVAEDIAFRLKLLGQSRAPLWYVPDPLYLYRIQPGSLSSRPDSTRLLISTLEMAIPDFDWHPDAQDAIRKRIGMAKQREVYLSFFNALMNYKYREAIRFSLTSPDVIIEFIRRTIDGIPYHFSRLKKGGAWKKKH